MYILFQILCLIGYYKILSTVPGAIQQVLVDYLFLCHSYEFSLGFSHVFALDFFILFSSPPLTF